jgi:molybdopterin-guanine dinucleotide biosynthesis protein A
MKTHDKETDPLSSPADITGVILSGGRNTRMGVNKAFLEIGPLRMMDQTLDIFRRLFSEILIVTNEPLSYLEFDDAALVTDIYKDKGPLGGIYTGLFYAKNPLVFACPCDMPFLHQDFIAYMIRQAGKHDIVVPELSEGYQPLHAIYSRNCLPSIKRLLMMDKLKITGFYHDMRVLAVGEEQIRPFNPDGRLFANLNTPGDVEKLAGKDLNSLKVSRPLSTGDPKE